MTLFYLHREAVAHGSMGGEKTSQQQHRWRMESPPKKSIKKLWEIVK